MLSCWRRCNIVTLNDELASFFQMLENLDQLNDLLHH